MKQTTNLATGYLCHCLRITAEQFDGMLEEMPHPTFAKLKHEHGIGSLCSSCEYEAKGVLEEYLLLHPQKAKGSGRPSGLREELGYAWGQLKQRARSLAASEPADQSEARAAKVYHTGIFFMRRDGLESHLVVSNLAFPEHTENVNGASASFRATLFGDEGRELAVSESVTVPNGSTLELSPAQLFPNVKGDFVGGLYVDYEPLVQTGSLRPYGVMVSTSPAFRARCHYHDKFALFKDPGYFQNTSPFEPGQSCWMAVSNCQPLPYETEAFLKVGNQKFSSRLSLASMASKWVKIEDMFPQIREVPADERTLALFWLENPQHVMVYFYWFNEANNTWMGQHH